jgi:hypothetical protein
MSFENPRHAGIFRGGEGMTFTARTGQRAEERPMDLYVIRRPSAWANLQELEAAGAKSARIGNEEMSDRVRWIRSYVVDEPDGRIGTFCIYEARDG